MVAGSILPVAIYKNKLYFLFGKENSLETSAKGWSDFGGGCENSETPFKTALREGAEELSGFLGDKKEIASLLKSGYHEIICNTYHVHICIIPYEPHLVTYYNNHHKFLWNRMDREVLQKTKLFEKCELRWFSESELSTKRKLFRNFYQEIVENIRADIPDIRKLITSLRR